MAGRMARRLVLALLILSATVFHEMTHMSPSYMRLALRHGRIKYPAFTNKDIDELEADLKKQPCHGCAAGKAKRRPHGGTHEDDGKA